VFALWNALRGLSVCEKRHKVPVRGKIPQTMSVQTAIQPISQTWAKTKILLEMIKFEHTVFALPFALAAAVVAANGVPPLRTLAWILVAMVGARSAAMAFNRIVDRDVDAENPRTSKRAIPSGEITVAQASLFTLASSAVFIVAAWQLGRLPLLLSPIALFIVLGYSYTKRFTALSHLFLGLALAVAPMGAWIAIRGSFSLPPILLSAAVAFWLLGFDILYSLQDRDFDVSVGLQSLPAKIGNKAAIAVSRVGHVVMVAFLIAFGATAGLHAIYFAGVAISASLIAYEQSLVRHDDLSRLGFAFFNVNGYISVAFFLITAADVMLRHIM